MKIYCKIENTLSRNLPNGKGGYEVKTFNFTPGQPVEIPDEYARAILSTRSNNGIFFSENQDVAQVLKYETESSPANEVIFTKEELEVLETSQLVSIAKEMGFKAVMPNWKRETLINKILGT